MKQLSKSILAFIVLVAMIALTTQAVFAAGPGTGWTYYRTVTLSAGTPSDNFQVNLQITDHANMNADGSDLRFYDPNDVQADYWIETWNPAGTSVVWVEVPTAGTTSLRMYYGNPAAAAASNGDQTFIVFDDFSRTAVDTSKWDVYDPDGSIVVSGGSITIIGGDQLISNTSFEMADGVIIESILSSSVPYRSGSRGSMSSASSISGSAAFFTADHPMTSDFAVWSHGRDNVYGIHTIHEGDGVDNGDSTSQYYQVYNPTNSPNTWAGNGNLLGAAFETGRLEYFLNNTSLSTSTTNIPDETMYPLLNNGLLTNTGLDPFSITMFRMRKFSSTYSPVVTVGAETAYDTDNPMVDTNDLKLSYTDAGPNIIKVTFSEDVFDPTGDSDPDDVTNPANYLLVEAGTNTIFDTTACPTAVSDDLNISVDSAAYDDGTFTATLNVNGGAALPNGSYRLLVCGSTSIVDLEGNPLAGDGATQGTDYIFNFTVNVPAPVAETGGVLPATGFARGVVTALPAQPAEKAYASSDLVLEIPKLGVKMDIVGVPLSGGEWDTSWLGQSAGWLEGSAFPTWTGNTILTGHVWDSNNNPGPFAQIKSLRYGDEIKIEAWDHIYIYQVVESKLVFPRNVNRVFEHAESDALTLLTCELYNPFGGNYFFRRIVTAVLVSVE
ncbi:MAG: sortase [Anaerolineales bacterium]|nr:sortase [Anaerolineales bacterium]